MKHIFIRIGALLLAVAVGFGAFGAHALKDVLTLEQLDIYQTAVSYQFYHSLGLLFTGLLQLLLGNSIWFRLSGWCLTSGVFIFSGSLYVLTLTGNSWLGAITPIGGVAFILGWIFIVVGVLNKPQKPADL